MTDIVKNIENIENTKQTNGLNLPINFDIEIEKSFQEFLNSEEFKNLQENSTKETIQEEFNKRLNNELHNLEEIKKENIRDIIQKTTFELQWFNTKVCLIWLQNNISENNIISSEIEVDSNINSIVKNIEQSPDFDINWEKTLADYIEQKDRMGAIKEIFSILWRLMKKNDKHGFSEYLNIIDLSVLENKDKDELNDILSFFESKIESTSCIKKDLKFTYILSRIKDQLLEKEDWIIDKKILLSKNLKKWDVILLNKVGKKDPWSKLLKEYDTNYETDFVHSAIIISEDWAEPIMIRHSTTFTAKKSGKWHVEEVWLFDYLQNSSTKFCDLLSLRPDENTKTKILNFSKENLWKEYDNNAALWWWIRWIDSIWASARWWIKRNKTWEKDDMYNCVEIVAQALDQEKLKDITHPNEFLEYMDIFQPAYMTTISF